MKAYKICLYAIFPCALIAMILQSIAFLTKMDAGTNYFARGAALPVLAVCFACCAVALGIAEAFLKRGKTGSTPGYKPQFPSLVCLPAAIGALGTAINGIICRNVWIAVLFLCDAVFWALCATRLVRKYAGLIAWVGFAAIAAPLYLLTTYYFDITVEMNAPVKVLLQFGMLAAMLWTTAEIRRLIDWVHTILYPILASLMIAIGALASVPIQVASHADAIPGQTYLAAVPVLFGMMLTAVFHLIPVIHNEFPAPESGESEENTPESGESEENTTESDESEENTAENPEQEISSVDNPSENAGEDPK